MNAEYFRTLFDYSYWARNRLLAAMEGITEADYTKPNGFTYESIRGILNHSLDAEFGWRSRFEGRGRSEQLDEITLPTLSHLVERWNEEEAKMRKYLANLSDEDLTTDLVWMASDGSERRLPNRWLSLAHVVNHTTQHRSEAAEALTIIGRSPGDLDLGLYGQQKLRG
ncbi:MAG: DinB family protein [Chloroflexota bacterium]